MATYDLSGMILLETTVAKMVADQASGATNFVGGATFTATYGATGQPTITNDTISGLWNRVQRLRQTIEKLPR